jgi:hypothetical protein
MTLLYAKILFLNEVTMVQVVKKDKGKLKKVADKVAKAMTMIGILLWTQRVKDEYVN